MFAEARNIMGISNRAKCKHTSSHWENYEHQPLQMLHSVIQIWLIMVMLKSELGRVASSYDCSRQK